ncbi:hypothetical protein GCM10010384_09300 [Streptomyces djakartensis]|uniref:Uncharacterized protein n=1 Tax=Streptomyces djakartensis TaxID=68193 RepID=A0ABQ2ZB92_9ACTN|nr:hypothetical protein GCM10010384_09300 [Streptomyces djakartensis]
MTTTTTQAATIARVRTSHSGKRCLQSFRDQRARSAATATTAGTVTSRTKVSGDRALLTRRGRGAVRYAG